MERVGFSFSYHLRPFVTDYRPAGRVQDSGRRSQRSAQMPRERLCSAERRK